MKGLLLKEWYVFLGCKAAWIMIPSLLGTCVLTLVDNSGFYMWFPCLLAGVTPVALMSCDGKDGWETYSCLLPVTKGQLVHAKYAICLMLLGAVALVGTLLAWMVRDGDGWSVLYALSCQLSLGVIPPAFVLPIAFRYGMETGSAASRVILFGCSAIGGAFGGLFGGLEQAEEGIWSYPWATMWPALLLGCLLLFGLSWRLSIFLYRKRQMV